MTSPAGSHPWADSTGKITPKAAAVYVCNAILNAGGQASTAFRCAFLIAEDLEHRLAVKPSPRSDTPALPRTSG
jgi:hypothetical protein